MKQLWIFGIFCVLCFQNLIFADYPEAIWNSAHSSNYTTLNSRTINRVVIHTVQGSYNGCISWFKNPAANVSAHYVVGYNGQITQMVKDKDKAWHCGSYNYRSIGIEHEGFAGENNWTTTQYEASAALTRYLCDTYNIPKDRTHIIEHKEVPGSTHWDPGPYFNWDYYIALVNNGSSSGGGSTTPNSTQGIEITASTLNVRDGIWGNILGQIHYGDKFVALSSSNGWYKINWKGQTAWISASYTKPYYGTGVKVTATALNVRTGPSSSYSSIGLVHYGQKYIKISFSDSWWKFQFDKYTRWSHGNYLTNFSLTN